MRTDLRAALAAELAAEQQQPVMRYSVTLSGEVAEAFERLRRDLGGEAVLSRGELTGRLLRLVLVEELPLLSEPQPVNTGPPWPALPAAARRIGGRRRRGPQ